MSWWGEELVLTVKQLQPAVSFKTEVFAIFDFGIQFIFDSQISHFAIDFDFIVISFLNWSQWDRSKNAIVSLSNKWTPVEVLLAVFQTSW